MTGFSLADVKFALSDLATPVVKSDLTVALSESKNRAGYFVEYQGADFVLTVGLIPEDKNIYLRLFDPDQSYKVLTGPLAVFAAMLVEYHRTNDEEED